MNDLLAATSTLTVLYISFKIPVRSVDLKVRILANLSTEFEPTTDKLLFNDVVNGKIMIKAFVVSLNVVEFKVLTVTYRLNR